MIQHPYNSKKIEKNLVNLLFMGFLRVLLQRPLPRSQPGERSKGLPPGSRSRIE